MVSGQFMLLEKSSSCWAEGNGGGDGGFWLLNHEISQGEDNESMVGGLRAPGEGDPLENQWPPHSHFLGRLSWTWLPPPGSTCSKVNTGPTFRQNNMWPAFTAPILCLGPSWVRGWGRPGGAGGCDMGVVAEPVSQPPGEGGRAEEGGDT